MNDEYIDTEGQIARKSAGALVAPLDPNDMRSIFHLLVGKPDSSYKSFRRRVTVCPEKLQDLHDRISEKLANHRVSGLVAAVDVGFDDNSGEEFGTWVQFKEFRWAISKKTNEIRMQWQFLVSVDNYEVPQRHNITVKISPHFKPLEVMRAVFSKDPSDVEDADVDNAPIICRVDFVNHTLGKELIAVVEEWVEALPQPKAARSWFNWFERHEDGFCMFMRYCTPILAAIAAFIGLGVLFKDSEMNSLVKLSDLLQLAQWAFASLFFLYVFDRCSQILSRKIYSSIQRYENHTIFSMTNGDNEKQENLEARNGKHVRSFFLNTFFNLLLNVLAGLVIYYGWSNA